MVKLSAEALAKQNRQPAESIIRVTVDSHLVPATIVQEANHTNHSIHKDHSVWLCGLAVFAIVSLKITDILQRLPAKKRNSGRYKRSYLTAYFPSNKSEISKPTKNLSR
ncbi:MAG: hypothetical protein P8J27_14090 [Mariniblastus sp.]|nr:hypothetical protein [Mariniblastus sp.]